MICGNNPPLRLLADEPSAVGHNAAMSRKVRYGEVAG
jgi:hypothetical protein